MRLFRQAIFYCPWIISGEPGEFVGEIVRNHPARDFHGYADKTATAKKILNDVWRKGDTCFRRYVVYEPAILFCLQLMQIHT